MPSKAGKTDRATRKAIDAVIKQIEANNQELLARKREYLRILIEEFANFLKLVVEKVEERCGGGATTRGSALVIPEDLTEWEALDATVLTSTGEGIRVLAKGTTRAIALRAIAKMDARHNARVIDE